MRKVLGIGANFLREQRVAVLLMVAWAILPALIPHGEDLREHREDLITLLGQYVVYGIAFAMFVGGSALHNERKSRRILAVLSKAVSRRQYISSLLMGAAMGLALYCGCLGVSGSLVLPNAGIAPAVVWGMVGMLWLACTVAAACAVMFSTFLPAILSGTAAGAVIGAVPALHLWMGIDLTYVMPVYAILMHAMAMGFQPAPHVEWRLIAIALAEIAIFWFVGTAIFARRDVAVATE